MSAWCVEAGAGSAHGACGSRTYAVTVAAPAGNEQPVRTAGKVNNLTVLEDSGTTTLGLSGLTYGTGGGSDESGQTLTYKVTAVPASTLGTIVLADGTTVVTANTT